MGAWVMGGGVRGDGVMRVDTTSDKAGEVVAKNESYALAAGSMQDALDRHDGKPSAAKRERVYGTALPLERINEACRLGYESVSARIVDRSAKAVNESDGRERVLLAGAHAQLLMLAMQGQVIVDDLRSELETAYAARMGQVQESAKLLALLLDMGISMKDIDKELKRGQGEPSAFKAVRRDAEPGPIVDGLKSIMSTKCSGVVEVRCPRRRKAKRRKR